MHGYLAQAETEAEEGRLNGFKPGSTARATDLLTQFTFPVTFGFGPFAGPRGRTGVIRSEKTIAVVGVSDQDVARLCLLLRRILPRLESRWRWGVENRADLVIADPRSFLGWMSWIRASASGVRCALLQPGNGQSSTYSLTRPFEAAQLEATLNAVSSESARSADVQPYVYDFYYAEMGLAAYARKNVNTATTSVGFDEYLRDHTGGESVVPRQELAHIASLRQPNLAAHVDPPADPTAWQLQPAKRSRGGLSLVHSRHEDEETSHTLWAYLTGDLLNAPRRLQRPGAPTLVLDPVRRVFHSEALLRQLQVHCNLSTCLLDWSRLSTTELDRVRRELPAQPYNKLLWLDALTHGDGQLATHLDPAGRYRLTAWLEIDDSLPRQQRIATTMVRARRLPEIAEVSRAPIGDVVDTVSAFDAINHVEWSRRPARAGHATHERERISSLVSRLRNLIDIHGRENIGLGQLRARSA